MIDISSAISALNWQREPIGLYAPIEYTLQTGGKRLRPTLALTACRLAGGDEQEALPLALAIEIFHNFTLLHDDVMDKADVRRGRPTVHVKWNANTAILSGDQMLIEAYTQLGKLPAQHLVEVLPLFNKMATEICEGQQYDVDFEQKEDVSISDYLHMITLKTSVLLATALECGAAIANAPIAIRQALYAYGIHVGLAFQIQDDLLDCFGDPQTFGKAIGGDICCNKKTYLLLSAFAQADAQQRAALSKWLQAPASEEKIAAVKELYTQTGARHAAERAIADHTAIAIAELQKVPQNEHTETLRQLAAKLAKRNT